MNSQFNAIFIEICPNEAILTNRAISFINLDKFDKALDDCKEALRINPNFAKAYKRMFKSYLSLGMLEVKLLQNNKYINHF